MCITKQQKKLNELKAAWEADGKLFPWKEFYNWLACRDAVCSTYVKQVEFINPHQVFWTSGPGDDECCFHNNGLPPEESISASFYVHNVD